MPNAESSPADPHDDTHSTYCPECGDGPFADVHTHWTNPQTDCEEPTLTPTQRALATGILLVRSQPDTLTNHIEFQTTNAALVDWLASSFGVLTAEITSEQGVYTWSSQAVADIEDLLTTWRTNDAETTVPLTPALARFLFAVSGELREVNGNPRPAFPDTHTTASTDTLTHLLTPFHPLGFDTADDGTDVYLQATEDFFEYIGPPLPGTEDKWVDAQHVLQANPARCPHCVNEYSYIEAHWHAGAFCSPPLLTWRQTELVDGILLGGGRLERTADGYRLVLTVDDEDQLAAVRDTFSDLDAGVYDRPEGLTWYSRSSPEFAQFERWLHEGEMQVPADLHHSARMLRLAYGLAGEFVDGKPTFESPHAYESDAFIERFFDDFDPMSLPSGVVLRDVSGFFGYIGWVPLVGCGDRWPHRE